MLVWIEGLSFLDAERRQHPAHFHVGGIDIFVLDALRVLHAAENAARITDRAMNTR